MQSNVTKWFYFSRLESFLNKNKYIEAKKVGETPKLKVAVLIEAHV